VFWTFPADSRFGILRVPEADYSNFAKGHVKHTPIFAGELRLLDFKQVLRRGGIEVCVGLSFFFPTHNVLG
jgi:hypothetical protein